MAGIVRDRKTDRIGREMETYGGGGGVRVRISRWNMATLD